jgi:hypothetical protein
MTILPWRTKSRSSVAPCPSAGALQYWTNLPRCRALEILADGQRHQCQKAPGQDDKHACPCGQDWKEK